MTNLAPSAADDAFSLVANTELTISIADDLLANDSDPDGDPLSLDGFTQPAHGSLVDNGDGTLTYTPDAGYAGADSFSYTISDGTDTATATVDLTINPPANAAPTPADDSFSLVADTDLTLSADDDLLANDADPDGDPLEITDLSDPANGTLADNGDGTLTYTPNAGYAGADSFTYTVSDGTDTATATVDLTIDPPANGAPTPADDALDVAADTPLTISAADDLLANDADPDGDALQVTEVSQPNNGTLADNGDGTFTYTPDTGYAGADNFSYTVSDGTDTATATVTLTVAAPPTTAPANAAPTPVDDSFTLAADANLEISVAEDLLANDDDPDGDTVAFADFTQPANGTLVDNGDGTLTYTPDAGYAGADAFTYTVTDGSETAAATVSLTVDAPDGTATNAAPTAAADSAATAEGEAVTIDPLANDSDADGDTLTISQLTAPANGVAIVNPDGTVTYTPDAGFTGDDSFDYTVDDGNGGSATASVTVSVGAAPQDPQAIDDTAEVLAGESVTIDALANDSDPNGDPLTVTEVGAAANGTVVDNGDGTFTYTPDDAFVGSDGFTYTIDDGTGRTSTAQVAVTVGVANGLPVAADDTVDAVEGTPLVLSLADLLANDTDASSHDAVARSAIGQFERTATAISTSGADRGAVVSVARNTTAARRWARGDCPRGPNRAFGTCVVTDGVVTQTRGNSTALVAVAVDISVRSPDADMRTTVVVRGVRGVVAADAAPRSP
mgnify:CR=1 FL=1